MSTGRTIFAAIALGASTLAVAPLTANAQTLHVTHITCHEQEDNTGADDDLGQRQITGPGNYEFTDDGAHYTVTVG
ncbi:hypothetical protein [Kribbella sp. NPDC003557]|uniref:hypothetical protein n=1 Tax=Kribbella sp. NPDC003557 TaxID=3154449 RepID=UPI0033BD286C